MKARILIVEDEKTALQALSLLLADEGYEILKAQTGEEGLRMTLQQEPDLVLARHPPSRRGRAHCSAEAASRPAPIRP